MKLLKIMAFVAMILALAVVILGAYTRLTDAGLGCPDWPGCYGHMVLPAQPAALQAAQDHYPTLPIEARKAWTEMGHRYAAGTLAILIGLIAIVARRQRCRGALAVIPVVLIGLVIFQAALGMWTVTLKLLPIVVMGHLLGGLLIFGHLVAFNLHLRHPGKAAITRWRCWTILAVLIVFVQIALGGWVSSNYAGLACIGFPQCNGQWIPVLDWQHSFQIWSGIGANHQGGLLDATSRATIQMVHRLGAVVIALYLLGLSVALLHCIRHKVVRRAVIGVLGCVAIQFALGVANVVYLLPLWAAVAHNGVAALLLAAVLVLHHSVRRAFSGIAS
ncbi:MAG: COX15/CtaA family protein [Gammaproteobacteria bacterium]|nr:COX15/CtaA family protein [Gammaproteobacteria bacterium]